MELPFTIVFEPPSHKELRALLRMRGHWVSGVVIALTIGSIYLLATVARADAGVAVAVAPLRLGSDPPGAAVLVDGRPRGATPLELSVEPGTHSVVLKAPQAVEQQYAVTVDSGGTTLDAVLWRRQPLVSRLRPVLPGAALADARLLENGSLGLSIALPPGDQLEAWRMDPRSGALEQLLPPTAGERLAFAPDGKQLAYIGRDVGPATLGAPAGAVDFRSPPANVVWLATADGEEPSGLRAWRAPLEPYERLVDLSWSPDGQRLLVFSTHPIGGGGGQSLSRAWLLDADTQHAETVLTLPSQAVPGTMTWSPDGTYVVFVAHAQQINALCLLTTSGAFRYVADLDTSSTPPLGYPVASWSPDSQRLLFVAPHQRVPGVGLDWLTPDTQHALYLATVDQPTPTNLNDTRLDQVTWREDGQVLGLWRGTSDSPLHIRQSDATGANVQDVLELPMQAGAQYAATWDLPHGELLITTRTSSSTPEFWLARLAADDSL